MSPRDRQKAQKLEAVMQRHDSYVQRTLADLRVAGFTFTTIGEARARLDAQRGMPAFTQSQINIAVAAIATRESR